MSGRYWATSLVFIIGSFAGLSANAAPPMITGAPALPPAGFVAFCANHLQECIGGSSLPAVVPLTAARRDELEKVQAEINRSLRPREDAAHVWDYPVDGTADCNKFALAKRRALIARGWPREALLLTAAVTEKGEGHLVLVARTSDGDLVLDSRLAPVVDWGRLPYRWLSRQSQRNPSQWLSIVDPAATLAMARAGRLAAP